MAIFDVFISYARLDGTPLAQKLAQSLRETGLNVFWDQDSIPPGANWEKALDTALEEAKHILVILTPASVVSEEVTAEWRPMLSKQKNIIPLMYMPCEMPRRLTMRQYIDFQDQARYALALNELLIALNQYSPDKLQLALSGEQLLEQGAFYLNSGHVDVALESFLQALNDPSPTIRRQVAHKLRDMRHIEALPGMFRALSKERDIDVKVNLLRAMVSIVEVIDWEANPPTWVADMEPYLYDKEPQVRREAIRVLAYAKLTDAAPRIVELLISDPASEVRYQAALSLGRLKTPAATQGLAQALLDHDPDTRRVAATALGLHADPQLIPALKHVARTDKVAAVRVAADEAISKIQANA